MKRTLFLLLTLTAASCSLASQSPEQKQERTGLIITKAGVEQIRQNLGKVSLFDSSLQAVKAEVDAEIEIGIDTPIPKDFSGGYTHQRHKQNFFIAQKAGALFQILDDERYAIYVRDMLLLYEAMYKDLPLHPQKRSYARGKLFWQCLNDSNWLVYMSQAYDSIYDWLSEDERQKLENNLFRPFADFISIENPQFFNRVHNHSTWGNAAVGMIGLVMGDDALVERALYGIPFDEIDASAKDDDGGFIYSEDGKAGFLANLEEPFSPDGYYTEGPYYQRYAMYPFLIFAQGLHNVKPELKIFEKEGKVLLNAVDVLLNLSDADGEFFPLNDGQKGMSYLNASVVSAVDIAYLMGGEDPRLLSIAEAQGQVLLDDAGIAVAVAIRDGKAMPFAKGSVNYGDGPDGKQGGVAVLRSGDGELELVFKYSAQGLSHGHYDKLSFSLYEHGNEVLQDYGMSRFVNIEQKGGGNYLRENSSWAKQTIAHNTITQNETSHFGGQYEIGSQHHSALHFFDSSNRNVQVVSARESNAYPDTEMLRTMAVITDENLEKPFVLDLLKINADSENQYDLPFHFMGQVIDTNFNYNVPESMTSLGAKNGYQHLFVEARGKASADKTTRFQWLGNQKFYTLTSVADDADQLLFTRIGANDPAFNLRRDAALIIRRTNVSDTVFASIIEPHGNYDPVSESATNSRSNVASLQVVVDDDDYTAILIEDTDGRVSVFIVANRNSAADGNHHLIVGDDAYQWTGPFLYKKTD